MNVPGGSRAPRRLIAGLALVCIIGLAGCANRTTPQAERGGTPAGSGTTNVHHSTATTTTTALSGTTTTSCPLSSGTGTAVTVPISEVCSSAGAPHFATPDSAMAYLSAAWNSGNVQELDYVTDPAGRQEMDSMAAQMVDLKFDSCSANPTGDYTCYFTHDIAPTDSSTTYPDPGGYPPGEAVFTVAPAQDPGWYLTEVIHCG